MMAKKPAKVKWPKRAWAVITPDFGITDFYPSKREAEHRSEIERKHYGQDAEIVRVEIRPAKGAK